MQQNEIENVLKTLNSDEQKKFLSIVGEFAKTGNSKEYDELLKADYEEVPVDIDTFIDGDEYLGKAWDHGNSIYPFWKEQLKNIFNSGKHYDECIFTGGIGLGKTSVAVIGMSYVLYCLLCLKNPQTYYGLPSSSRIVIAFFNTILSLSTSVAYTKMQDMLSVSPWFLRHGKMVGHKDSQHYVPDKHIEFAIGSIRSMEGLGKDIFCIAGDTKIKTDSNTYEEIQNLSDNFKLYTYNNIENKQLPVSTDTKAMPTKKTKNLYKITLKDGTVLVGSYNHKMLMSNGEYKQFKDMQIGDDLKEISKEDNKDE